MGLFRLILALSVVVAHIEGTPMGAVSEISRGTWYLGWAGNAVFSFFIVSGFYMSMVINERYQHLPKGRSRFYLNRILRIYPIHLLIIGGFVLLFHFTNQPNFMLGDTLGNSDLRDYAIITNLGIIGVEALIITDPENWKYVLGPIWTLSIELYFYLLAPFIVLRPTRIILMLAAAALAFRFTQIEMGYELLPWRYFFFPSVLIFFLMGVLSYRLYDVSRHWWINKPAGWLALAALTTALLLSDHWAYDNVDNADDWALYAMVMLVIPFLFRFSCSSSFDKFLGNLSYPVYLLHILVIKSILGLADTSQSLIIYGQKLDWGLLAILITLVLAVILYAFIEEPIEHLRRRFKK